MKKTLSLLAVLMAAGVAATPAQAAKHYVSGFGGISWMNNLNTSEVYQAVSGNHSRDFDLGSGLALTGAIGCDYGNYRFEAEVGYQTNDVKSATHYIDGIAQSEPTNASGSTTTTTPAWRGDVSALTLMGNGYYDFDLGSKVELYATAGVGVAQVSFHDVNNVTDVSSSAPYTFTANPDPGLNGHETTLAWQVGAGIAAPIADNVKLDLRYRYFATTDFTSFTGDGPINTNLSSHSVLLGLRVDF